jgi:IS1 family transposase
VQFDEKWSFVERKEKHCQPEDTRRGDCWDHTAIDPESRWVVSLVVGKRTAEVVSEVLQDFHRRTGGRVMRLMTSDEYPAYVDAIRSTYGTTVVPPRTGRPGRPRKPDPRIPPEVTDATIHKHRENNRVVRVSTRVVFGTLVAVALALLASAVSRAVNTCFVERHNGTDRNRCSRKVRKTYAFSKNWDVHQAATRFSHFSYNFCWPVRTLRVRGENGAWQKRTPAMAAGLTDHVWTLREWLSHPAVQRR